MRKVTLTSSSRRSLICLSWNKTLSSPPSVSSNKIKSLSEDTQDDELSAGSIYDFSIYPLVTDGDFKIDDVSDGHRSMNSHTLSQHDWYLTNGDVSCGNIL